MVVWIEIFDLAYIIPPHLVTTFMVVWIEIFEFLKEEPEKWSPPLWWCGLKS